MYGFSFLVKQNKKAEICFVIYIAGFFFLNFLCYEVFAKQKIYKLSSNYYYQVSPTRRDIDVDFNGRGTAWSKSDHIDESSDCDLPPLGESRDDDQD